MFEVLINLMLTGLFLQAQAESQSLLNVSIEQSEYRLPQAQVRELYQQAPQRVVNTDSVGVEVTAKSFLVLDEATDKVLYSKNVREVRSIASLTKMMSALVFLDNNPGWDKVVTMAESDYRAGAVNYFIAGEEISVRDLFNVALVASSNEATVALARSTGMSLEEFVASMNQQAVDWGLVNTVFFDVTGLNPGNQSTAVEVMSILKMALAEEDIAQALGTTEYVFKVINKGINRRVVNTNWILGHTFGADGQDYYVEKGKTGHLDESGYCLASRVNNHGQKILIVVLGSETVDDRFNDTKSLAYWVFKNYVWQIN